MWRGSNSAELHADADLAGNQNWQEPTLLWALAPPPALAAALPTVSSRVWLGRKPMHGSGQLLRVAEPAWQTPGSHHQQHQQPRPNPAVF